MHWYKASTPLLVASKAFRSCALPSECTCGRQWWTSWRSQTFVVRVPVTSYRVGKMTTPGFNCICLVGDNHDGTHKRHAINRECNWVYSLLLRSLWTVFNLGNVVLFLCYEVVAMWRGDPGVSSLERLAGGRRRCSYQTTVSQARQDMWPFTGVTYITWYFGMNNRQWARKGGLDTWCNLICHYHTTAISSDGLAKLSARELFKGLK